MFWHHLRLRALGIMATLAITLLLAWYLPDAAMVPILVGAVIAYCHQRQGALLLAESFIELDDLRAKITALEANASQKKALQSVRDKRPKAG